MQAGFFAQTAAAGGKRDRTHAALLDAAIAVVASKGMEAAKISDMTETAGLANGTFYNHFATKEDILQQVAFKIAFEVSRRLDADMEGIDDAALRVVTATMRFAGMMLDSPDWAAVLLDGRQHLADPPEEMFRFLKADLELGVRQGVFDVETDAFTLEQVTALMGSAIQMQLIQGHSDDLMRRLCTNVLRVLGVTASKASRVLERYDRSA